MSQNVYVDRTLQFNKGGGGTLKVIMDADDSADILYILPATDATEYVAFGNATKNMDVKFFGNTSGAYMLWDESADDLLLVGTATQLAVAGTTDTSSATTGSLRTAGGVGIEKALWVGTTSRLVGVATFDAGIVSDATTDTSSTITGAIQTDGGIGIAKALWVGTTSRHVGVATFDVQDIHTLGLTVANAAPVVQGMNTFSKLTVTVLTSGAGYNMSAAQMLSGCISDTSATGAIAATLPSVASVVALIPGYVAGTAFYLDYRNPGNQTVTITVDAGAQWTLVGTMTIATVTHKRFLCVINSATTGTIYSVGASTA